LTRLWDFGGPREFPFRPANHVPSVSPIFLPGDCSPPASTNPNFHQLLLALAPFGSSVWCNQ
jgi:hypothetical protein